MNSVKSLEPAIDPVNKVLFLLDWELTLKCNLDCAYCPSGIQESHDNSTRHPPLADCLKTIDFMFEYADMYMLLRPKSLRQVVLNVYGGESLHHPDIVTVLEQVRERYQPYRDRWNITITTTTNAIVSDNKFAKIIPLIDEFTTSYHTHTTDKQKQQFKKNLLAIKSAGRRLRCVTLMHPEPELFTDANNMIAWLAGHDIRHLPRALDHISDDFNYWPQQIKWFDNVYQSKSFNSTSKLTKLSPNIVKSTNMLELGRACCGGRQLHQDQNYKTREFFVANRFPDWHCSVNHFFLYIKQYTGDVYINKDCRMNFNGTVGPIGNLKQASQLLSETKNYIDTDTMPVIQCKKTHCRCGLCAPKAATRDEYDTIIKKYFIKKTS